MTELKHIYSGKVRDLYDAGDGNLLFVASNRLSVFDVVLGETVPEKGRALTAISAFWFDELDGVLPNHVVDQFPDVPDEYFSYASGERATTIKPDVSRSRRWTMPARSSSSPPSAPASASACASVPLACPGPGWTTTPAGLSTTRRCSSS